MKKALTLFASVAFVAMLFTSCKKDYTCTCTDSAGSIPYTYTKVSKKTADQSCTTLNSLWILSGGSCKLN